MDNDKAKRSLVGCLAISESHGWLNAMVIIPVVLEIMKNIVVAKEQQQVEPTQGPYDLFYLINQFLN